MTLTEAGELAPRELKIMVAKGHGYRKYPDGRPFWMLPTTTCTFGPSVTEYNLPDYLEDLDAIYAAVETLRGLDGPQWFDFQKCLIEQCGSVMNAIQAGPRERCIAFIVAITGGCE